MGRNLLCRSVFSGWQSAAREGFAALETVLGDGRKPLPRLALVLVATFAAWVAYVPLHELLHAFGCRASGGEVRELQIQPFYGGTLLARFLPFVRSGGDAAGRLTRFDTRGSDVIYLATDLAPFLLTLVGAFPLLALARQRRSAALLGPGIVLAAAPLVSLTGDLYEMGSIFVTMGLGVLPWPGGSDGLSLLRHDDLVALLGEFGARFQDLQMIWGSAIVASFLVGGLLGNAILAASQHLNESLGRARARSPRVV